ncbi:hypothetical protein AA637_00625 [Cyanobacterium sp. HL-69]|uniref:hypothetical protein n=1 Tax=unclassified Cyanobacterium TaxID=2629879 RepID=UPI00086E5532|nr:hypothetical protein [Cyanobacterium sp. IPPAS B-1200]AUC59733.1 hypothetical protein AA637_00625 [Cyanobacterium sp. HL-69]OEJ79786.1 hypothetical protein A5482_09240 [Cyanobacterium sp. IPPAS B-1200]
MSTTITTGWTKAEIQITEQVLKKAYERETKTLVQQVKDKINNLEDMEELWQVHDLLSSKRYDLDGKYDNREPMLVFTFAELLKEGWIKLEELAGLDKGKLAQISSLSRM